MANRQLTAEELKTMFAPLIAEVRGRLDKVSRGDADLLFALRRKLAKELSYDERGKPMARRQLKAFKRGVRISVMVNALIAPWRTSRSEHHDRSEATLGDRVSRLFSFPRWTPDYRPVRAANHRVFYSIPS